MRNLFLSALLLLSSGFAVRPVVHAEPLDFGWLCSHQAQYPFIGIGLCDDRNISCAAVASVFTWYAGDVSVDAGYDRGRNIFAPTGWRDWANKKPELPSTYDTVSNTPPMHMPLVWQQIHSAHHDAIAYTSEYPPGAGDNIIVAQFEYLSGQLDHDGMPLAGAKPLRARQWLVSTGYIPIEGFRGDSYGRLNSIISTDTHQGVIIDGSDIYDNNPIKTPPKLPQSLKQRWSCQHLYNQRQS